MFCAMGFVCVAVCLCFKLVFIGILFLFSAVVLDQDSDKYV